MDLISLATVVAACNTPNPEPAPGVQCTYEGTLHLLREFFRLYDLRELDFLMALFHNPSSRLQYRDEVIRNVADVRDFGALRAYFQQRFARGDRLRLREIQLLQFEGPRPTSSPVASFARESTEGRQCGSGKFVCEGGRFVQVIMSSRLAVEGNCS